VPTHIQEGDGEYKLSLVIGENYYEPFTGDVDFYYSDSYNETEEEQDELEDLEDKIEDLEDRIRSTPQEIVLRPLTCGFVRS